jgi:hypothetical protein
MTGRMVQTEGKQQYTDGESKERSASKVIIHLDRASRSARLGATGGHSFSKKRLALVPVPSSAFLRHLENRWL